MNEELKIIITAVTADAKKSIQGVSKELKGMEGAAGKGGSALKSMGTIAKGAMVAVAAVATAVVGLTTALVKLSSSTAEYRKSMAQLNTAFQANGASAAQAQKTYSDLYRFMGETDTAVETANLLSQLTTDEKELAQWTKTLQGVYATFPDSLPIEGLVEASNETARVGKVTGTLADALNWAGVSEDEFNAKLAQTTTLSEREALIRETLNGLYNNAAELYEKNAAAILAQNEAQARLDNTLARAGAATQPLQTALTDLAATLLNALLPAIETIVPYIVTFINYISMAVNWVVSFINALTGSNKAVKATESLATSVKSVGNTAQNAAKGAGSIASGLNKATKEAEKLKRVTASFDELNVISKPTTSSSGSSGGSGGSSGGGGYAGAIGGGSIGSSDIGLTDAFDTTSESAERFAKKIKSIFENIKTTVLNYAGLFTPTFEAWGSAFSSLQEPMANAFVRVGETLSVFIDESLVPFGLYLLEDFIPSIVNSFSENFAPIFSDVMTFAIDEWVTHFEWGCGQLGIIIEEILTPTLELLKTITIDTFETIGNEWDKSGEALLTNLSGVFESIRELWENLYNNILKPVWDSIIGALDGMWDESLNPLLEKLLSFFSKVGECVMTIWNNFLSPIVNWVVTVLSPLVINAVEAIMGVVSTVVGLVSDVVGGILDALGGLLDFITGVFSGDWKKAWTGIKNFFKGIWDAIWGICKGVVNLIIDGINMLWSGIYSVIAGLVNGIGSIAGAIGDLFGQDWNFSMPKKPPLIPKLATGGIVTRETLATIGENGKEAVLPLENNTGWMDTLAEKISAKNNNGPTKLVLMVDGKELGYATIGAINNITKQTGSLQLALI